MSCAHIPNVLRAHPDTAYRLSCHVCLLLGRRWRFGRAGGCGGYESGVDSWAELAVVAVNNLFVRWVQELVLRVASAAAGLVASAAAGGDQSPRQTGREP